MIHDNLHTLARKDSPEVLLPGGWPGTLAWMVTKFGVSFVLAIILMYGISEIYKDQKRTNERLLDAFQSNTQTMIKFQISLEKIMDMIEDRRFSK